jgi:pantothenate kinase
LIDLLQKLLDQSNLSNAEFEQLCQLSREDPIDAKLIHLAGLNSAEAIRRRSRSLNKIEAAVSGTTLQVLWSHLIPLAEVVLSWSAERSPCIVGFAGLPGSGKTTLTRKLASVLSAMSDQRIIAVSLDDFYLTPTERDALGLRWRAVPGSHDLKLLAEFLSSIHSNTDSIKVPSYDTRAEVRLESRQCSRPEIVLLDGWLLGASAPGYEFVEASLDHVVFVDMELEIAHQSRLTREENIRRESAGQLGMSAEDTDRFWNEALLPTGVKCVTRLTTDADIILKVDEHYRIVDVSFPKGNDRAVQRRT